MNAVRSATVKLYRQLLQSGLETDADFERFGMIWQAAETDVELCELLMRVHDEMVELIREQN